MKLSRLGDLISLNEEKNKDLYYGISNVKGISINKIFIETKADLKGVSLKPYIVVKPNFFAYVSVTSRNGDKVSMAFNNTNETYIVSSSYVSFYVKDTTNLLPEFLYIYFNRPEFDRIARFNSWGSARETFSWDDLCDLEIIVPSIEIQQKYVDIYVAISNNKKSYQNGLDDLKMIYTSMFEDAQIKYPKVPLLDHTIERREFNSNGQLSNLNGVSQDGLIPPNQKRSKDSLKKTKIFYYNDIVYAPSSLKNGAVVLNKILEKAICSEEYIVLSVTEKFIPEFLFILLKRKELGRYIDFLSVDSVRNRFYYKDLEVLDIPLVPLQLQEKIVSVYNCYLTRKNIVDRLSETLKELSSILIKGATQESKGVI